MDGREGVKKAVKSKMVPIRFSPELVEALDTLVELTGTNRSDVIRRCIPNLSREKRREKCTV